MLAGKQFSYSISNLYQITTYYLLSGLSLYKLPLIIWCPCNKVTCEKWEGAYHYLLTD